MPERLRMELSNWQQCVDIDFSDRSSSYRKRDVRLWRFCDITMRLVMSACGGEAVVPQTSAEVRIGSGSTKLRVSITSPLIPPIADISSGHRFSTLSAT